MSSIFSTQKRQTFLRRKYAFFCVATALSPPVGRCPALPGLPLNSGMGSPYASLGASFGRPGMAGAFAHHLLGHGRWRRGRRGNRLAMRALVAVLLALFQALQRLVDAHSQKLDDQVRDAQPALEFLDGFVSRGKLEQDVSALAVPVDFVGQLALAPFFHFVHRAAGVRDGRLHLFDEGVHLLVRRVRLRYKQLFVNSHASSFEPGARRLNFVMAFSTPSAIMETTASAPSAPSCSNSLRSERLNGDSKYSIPLLSGWPG